MQVLLEDQMVFHQLSSKIHVRLSAILLHLFFNCYSMMAAFRQYGEKPSLQQFIERVIAPFLPFIGQFH